jgi:hypothetical protein
LTQDVPEITPEKVTMGSSRDVDPAVEVHRLRAVSSSSSEAVTAHVDEAVIKSGTSRRSALREQQQSRAIGRRARFESFESFGSNNSSNSRALRDVIHAAEAYRPKAESSSSNKAATAHEDEVAQQSRIAELSAELAMWKAEQAAEIEQIEMEAQRRRDAEAYAQKLRLAACSPRSEQRFDSIGPRQEETEDVVPRLLKRQVQETREEPRESHGQGLVFNSEGFEEPGFMCATPRPPAPVCATPRSPMCASLRSPRIETTAPPPQETRHCSACILQ